MARRGTSKARPTTRRPWRRYLADVHKYTNNPRRFGFTQRQRRYPDLYFRIDVPPSKGGRLRVYREDHENLIELAQTSRKALPLTKRTLWFWLGQMVHYGLDIKSLKVTNNTTPKMLANSCKNLLMSQYHCGKLVIPAHLREWEANALRERSRATQIVAKETKEAKADNGQLLCDAQDESSGNQVAARLIDGFSASISRLSVQPNKTLDRDIFGVKDDSSDTTDEHIDNATVAADASDASNASDNSHDISDNADDADDSDDSSDESDHSVDLADSDEDAANHDEDDDDDDNHDDDNDDDIDDGNTSSVMAGHFRIASLPPSNLQRRTLDHQRRQQTFPTPTTNVKAPVQSTGGSSDATESQAAFRPDGNFTREELAELHRWRDRFCNQYGITRAEFQVMMTRSHARGNLNWTYDRWMEKELFLKTFRAVLPVRTWSSMLAFRRSHNWDPPSEAPLVRQSNAASIRTDSDQCSGGASDRRANIKEVNRLSRVIQASRTKTSGAGIFDLPTSESSANIETQNQGRHAQARSGRSSGRGAAETGGSSSGSRAYFSSRTTGNEATNNADAESPNFASNPTVRDDFSGDSGAPVGNSNISDDHVAQRATSGLKGRKTFSTRKARSLARPETSEPSQPLGEMPRRAQISQTINSLRTSKES